MKTAAHTGSKEQQAYHESESPAVSRHWPYGALRGGTNAVFLPQHNVYLAFFHSAGHLRTNALKTYFMGAYTFSTEPPFSITAISEEPIIGEDFYNKQKHYYWSPRRVIFPCGCLADEHFIWVSYGKEDREMWIAKIDKKMLLDSLVPVFTMTE